MTSKKIHVYIYIEHSIKQKLPNRRNCRVDLGAVAVSVGVVVVLLFGETLASRSIESKQCWDNFIHFHS